MSQFTVAMLVASTRTGSINVRLAKAIEALAPETLSFNWVQMDDLPFYHGDLEGDRPAAVRRFVSEIEAADAVCIVTPEYNRSIPAVLKNAIDWGSKPGDRNVWRDKVVAMSGTSPGGIGTAVGQQHLRQILSILNAVVVPGEVYVTFKTPDMIDAAGNVADDSVRDFIAAFAKRFEALIRRMRD
ncbi:NADPH-dependent FMN reductase [Paracoccus luteus]|uniref:NADPH-dependent FMN reductase n=1 Tax=Paracoccus luteus TaxID=2508543 RepID=UPI00106FFCF5|nr:NADPH-dependent FMN reductase [Paracoccus luteus]